MHEKFAKTPEPPYYAVLFTAQRSDDDRGYGAMAEKIHAMALASPGCLGAESAYDGDGFGFTLSYWKDEVSISSWKQNADHLGRAAAWARNAGMPTTRSGWRRSSAPIPDPKDGSSEFRLAPALQNM